MKKNKLFIALACLAMAVCGLAACGNGGGGGESTPAVPSDHKHSYGDWVTVVEPTCTEKGSKERTCECGAKETKEINALDHDWDDGKITTAATCSTPGVLTYTCKRAGCGATKTEPIVADHVWGDPVAVAAPKNGDGKAAYNKSICTVCNESYKLEIAAKQGKVTGSLKTESRFPDYIKFSNKNDYTTLTFNYNAPATGEIYLRGVMDYWHDGNNENQNKEGFFAGKNNNDGNFKLTVNGAEVDYSWAKGLKYSDMFPEEGQDGNFSQLADCKVGTVNLVAGKNIIVYERLESYNLLVKDFVIIVKNTGPEVLIEEGYDVNFTHTHAQVYVFPEGQDYSVAPVKSDYAETTDENGAPCQWTEARETADLLPQVNFKVVCDEGYEVDADCLAITGTFNKIKIVSNDETDNSWIIRITKIHSDLTVAITPKEKVEGAVDGHEVTFALTNCTVKVYIGPKDETGSNVDTSEKYYTRGKTEPYDYTKTEGQIIFEVVPASGFEFKDGITWPEAGEVSSSAVSFIAPSANYNKLKLNADGTYKLTKVSGSVTITIACTAIGA